MKKFCAMQLAFLVVIFMGCLANPRVLKCHKCGDRFAVIGTNLPREMSYCTSVTPAGDYCGGAVTVSRYLTRKEWNEAKERWGVTE